MSDPTITVDDLNEEDFKAFDWSPTQGALRFRNSKGQWHRLRCFKCGNTFLDIAQARHGEIPELKAEKALVFRIVCHNCGALQLAYGLWPKIE